MSDVEMQDLLAAMTDALLMDADNTDFDVFIADSPVPREAVDKLTPLILDLHGSFPPVKPSPEFSAQLKSELTGAQYYRLMWRLRRLPPRVHVAAFMAIVGGVLIIWRRRFNLSPMTAADEMDVEEVIA